MSNRRTAGAPPSPNLFMAPGLVLVLVTLAAGLSARRASGELHTLIETVACLLAWFVAVLALTRYYTRMDRTFLLIGTAFLGTGMLDGLHAALGSFVPGELPSAVSSLAPWSWSASRLFLALCLWLSAALRRFERNRRGPAAGEWSVLAAAAGLVLMSVLPNVLVPHPDVRSPESLVFFPERLVSRPAELASGLLFLLGLAGWVREERRREDPFKRWLVGSLVLSVLVESIVLLFSGSHLEGWTNAAHLMKLASYGCVVAGLVKNMHDLFRRAELTALENRRVQVELENEVKERRRAEAELLVLAETLEERVAERTDELAWSRTAALNMMEDADEARRAAELAEASLVNYARQLERSNADLQQFAYVASHDLQEPLRQVASYAQLLARRYRGRLDRSADDFIDFMVDGARRMQQLIQDLLSFSRVGSRGGEMKEIECDSIVDRVLADLGNSIEESDARVTREPLPTVTADGTQLSQLFQNLVANAIKFRGEARPEVHIGAEQRNGDWLFRVRDNGIGIRPEFAEKIFVIFQRLHGREEYPGTGIGLAICKRIVERHEGHIWVEPNEDGGSTFLFTIPAEHDEGRPEETQPEETQ